MTRQRSRYATPPTTSRNCKPRRTNSDSRVSNCRPVVIELARLTMSLDRAPVGSRPEPPIGGHRLRQGGRDPPSPTSPERPRAWRPRHSPHGGPAAKPIS